MTFAGRQCIGVVDRMQSENREQMWNGIQWHRLDAPNIVDRTILGCTE